MTQLNRAESGHVPEFLPYLFPSASPLPTR